MQTFNTLDSGASLLYTNQESNSLVIYLLVFLANVTYYIVFFLKFYQILCFSKITFDGLPMINPYIWPFSIFRVLTQPYFAFWARILPSVKAGKYSFDISVVIGLEGLSTLIYLCKQLRIIALENAAEMLL